MLLVEIFEDFEAARAATPEQTEYWFDPRAGRRLSSDDDLMGDGCVHVRYQVTAELDLEATSLDAMRLALLDAQKTFRVTGVFVELRGRAHWYLRGRDIEDFIEHRVVRKPQKGGLLHHLKSFLPSLD